MTAEFTAEEEARLTPYFTNLDRPTFGLKLPQEVAGALFSRYSRSTKSLRRTFLDEFLGDPALGLSDLLPGQAEPAADNAALKKARAFYERVLVGYGDDSVAQLGGAHLACENISNVAAKLLEDARIGIAPLEKSTRYVRFDQKDTAGNYLFYREPKIMASRHRDAYLEVMNLLFDTYSRQMEPMLTSIAKALPIEQLEVRDPTTGKALAYADAQKDDRLRRWAETAYRATVRAHACDVLRSYLPAATLTNVGMFGFGQAFEYLISKFYSHELSEAQELGRAMHGELNQLIPSFVKRAQLNEYLVGATAAAKMSPDSESFPSRASAPATISVGSAGIGIPICSTSTFAKTSAMPYCVTYATSLVIAFRSARRRTKRETGSGSETRTTVAPSSRSPPRRRARRAAGRNARSQERRAPHEERARGNG